MPKELIWNDDLVQKFWTYYSDKTETYYAEVFGNIFVYDYKKYIPNNGICIDYGCGSGGLVKSLLNQNIKTIGIDDNTRSVELLKKRFKKNDYLVGSFSIQEVKKQKIKADVIFSLEAIEHVLESRLTEYFTNIKSLIKENGIFIISCPNDEDIENGKVYCPESDKVFHPTQHMRSLNKENIKSFVESYGFENIEIIETDLSCHYRYSKSNYYKMKLREMKASLFGYAIQKPHLIAIFKNK